MHYPICHSERSAAKSKNLHTYSYICGEMGAKILRLALLAQDDKTSGAVTQSYNIKNPPDVRRIF